LNLHEIRDRTALASEVRGRYEVVSAENAERVAMIRERREEYRNTQVGLPTSGGVPLPPSARAEKRHDIKVPYAHFHTVNTTGRLVGELPQSHVVPRQENPEERERAEQIEKMLASTYYHSQGEVALQSVEWHNAIFGHGFLRVYWDYTSNMPRFSTVRPELFFPKFATSAGDEWDYAIYAAKRSAASVAAKYNVPVTELQEDDEELGGNRQFVTVSIIGTGSLMSSWPVVRCFERKLTALALSLTFTSATWGHKNMPGACLTTSFTRAWLFTTTVYCLSTLTSSSFSPTRLSLRNGSDSPLTLS